MYFCLWLRTRRIKMCAMQLYVNCLCVFSMLNFLKSKLKSDFFFKNPSLLYSFSFFRSRLRSIIYYGTELHWISMRNFNRNILIIFREIDKSCRGLGCIEFIRRSTIYNIHFASQTLWPHYDFHKSDPLWGREAVQTYIIIILIDINSENLQT